MKLEVSAYTVPTDKPESDGTFAWDKTTLVVVEASAAGATGLGWTYAPAAAGGLVAELLEPALGERDPLDVPGAWAAMVAAVRKGRAVGPGHVRTPTRSWPSSSAAGRPPASRA